MNIFLINPHGFCAGVERAIDIVEKSLEKFGSPIYVRHDIVHNKHVVNNLKNKGVIFVKEIDQIPDNSVVITSAHGISRKVRNDILKREFEYIDATCPLVSKVHMQVQSANKKGFYILFIGHKNHPEAHGTCGQSDTEVQIIETIEDVDKIKIYDPDKMMLVTQTTLSLSDTKDIIEKIKLKIPNIKLPAKKDICYATENRQNAVLHVASNVDYMFIFGSSNSSNSNRLVEVARNGGCINSFLISHNDDIDPSKFDPSVNIGISAGASCPEYIINNFIDSCKALNDNVKVEIINVVDENVKFRMPASLMSS